LISTGAEILAKFLPKYKYQGIYRLPFVEYIVESYFIITSAHIFETSMEYLRDSLGLLEYMNTIIFLLFINDYS